MRQWNRESVDNNGWNYGEQLRASEVGTSCPMLPHPLSAALLWFFSKTLGRQGLLPPKHAPFPFPWENPGEKILAVSLINRQGGERRHSLS